MSVFIHAPLRRVLTHALAFEPGARASRSEVMRAVEAWCHEQQVIVPGTRAVVGELLAIGCQRRHANGKRWFAGVRPRPVDDPARELVSVPPTVTDPLA